MPKIPRVFISYSHDTRPTGAVLELADQLRGRLRRTLRSSMWRLLPTAGCGGWTQCLNPTTRISCCWSARRLPQRVEGREEPGLGNGVQWEGKGFTTRLIRGSTRATDSSVLSLRFGQEPHPLAALPTSPTMRSSCSTSRIPGISSSIAGSPGRPRTRPRRTTPIELITSAASFRSLNAAESTVEQIVDLDCPKAAAQSDSSLEVLKFRRRPPTTRLPVTLPHSPHGQGTGLRSPSRATPGGEADEARRSRRSTTEPLPARRSGLRRLAALERHGPRARWRRLRAGQVVGPRPRVLPRPAPAPPPPRGAALGSAVRPAATSFLGTSERYC